MPELMDETLITAILGNITTSILSFNNPLLYPVNVKIELISETNAFQVCKWKFNNNYYLIKLYKLLIFYNVQN